LHIPFHLLHCWCNTCTNHITNKMIHFISSHDRIGSSILTSLALHRCFGPSAPSHHSTFPSRLQPIHQAKSYLDLLHLSHMTPCHVSYAWAPSSHVWMLQHIQVISPPWHRLLTHKKAAPRNSPNIYLLPPMIAPFQPDNLCYWAHLTKPMQNK
jgi:hypothetical protein